jgi:AcrR family transcriptional regulator
MFSSRVVRMPSRRRTPSQALEPAILEAAEALLEDVGPAALSVRGIAERAGVAPMGLYSRFDGKFGVVDALFQEGFAALGAAMRSSADGPDPLEGFLAAGAAYRELALAHPARYGLMFLHAVPGHEPSEEAVATADDAFRALVDVVRRCVDAGALAPGDPVEIAQQVWASCHGWVSLELGGISFVADNDGGYVRLLGALVAGLAPGPADAVVAARGSRRRGTAATA